MAYCSSRDALMKQIVEAETEAANYESKAAAVKSQMDSLQCTVKVASRVLTDSKKKLIQQTCNDLHGTNMPARDACIAERLAGYS